MSLVECLNLSKLPALAFHALGIGLGVVRPTVEADGAIQGCGPGCLSLAMWPKQVVRLGSRAAWDWRALILPAVEGLIQARAYLAHGALAVKRGGGVADA